MQESQLEQKDLVEILSLCSKGVSILGSKDFKSAISNIITTHEITYNNQNVFIDFIIDCVLEEWKAFKFKRDDFFKSNQRGEIIVARNMAIVLIKVHTKISYSKTANYFGLENKQSAYNIINKHNNNMDANNSYDAKLLAKYETLKIKVLDFINKLKNND